MDMTHQIALVICWDDGVDLPSVVGPFATVAEAGKWANQNIPNGTWEYRAMTRPYLRAPGGEVRLL